MLNVLWRLRKKNSKTQLPLSSLGYEFKQFLFFLTFPDNKEKVFRESKNSLSFSEKILLIRMERDNGNEWEEAA